MFDENTNLTGNTEVYYKVQEQVKHELQYSIPSLTMFRAQAGWNSYNGNRYYFNTTNDDGVAGMMRKGWQKINGVWYYFNYSDGKMASNT